MKEPDSTIGLLAETPVRELIASLHEQHRSGRLVLGDRTDTFATLVFRDGALASIRAGGVEDSVVALRFVLGRDAGMFVFRVGEFEPDGVLLTPQSTRTLLEPGDESEEEADDESEEEALLPLRSDDLCGSLETIAIFDVLEFLHYTRQSGRLSLEESAASSATDRSRARRRRLSFADGPRAGLVATALLRRGEIVCAACGALRGVEAVRAMLRQREGDFRFEKGEFEPGPELDGDLIEASTSQLPCESSATRPGASAGKDSQRPPNRRVPSCPDPLRSQPGRITGSLQSISSVALIQALTATRQTGRLTVEDTGSPRATAVFRGGTILSATCRRTHGPHAVQALLREEYGTFVFAKGHFEAETGAIPPELASLLMRDIHEYDRDRVPNVVRSKPVRLAQPRPRRSWLRLPSFRGRRRRPPRRRRQASSAVRDALLAPAPSDDLSGTLEMVSIFDFIQFVNISRQSGRLVVGAETAPVATAVFREGEIMSATCRDLEGAEAVYALLGERRGAFRFVRGEFEPAGAAIGQRTTALLMEGCRRQDEAEQAAPRLRPFRRLLPDPPRFRSVRRALASGRVTGGIRRIASFLRAALRRRSGDRNTPPLPRPRPSPASVPPPPAPPPAMFMPEPPAAPAPAPAEPPRRAEMIGSLEIVAITDVIRFLHSTERDGRLVVGDRASPTATAVFRAGQIVCASCVDLHGVEAVRALLRMAGGAFYFERGEFEPDSDVIATGTEQLLADACQRPAD